MITLKEIRRINREFREKDDSSLWPINGAFSVAERAIRKARELARHSGGFNSDYEYQLCLESIASEIVNNPKNW